MDHNREVIYEIVTGSVEQINKLLNEDVRKAWRPILMSALSTNVLAVLLEGPKPPATGYTA